MRDDDARYDQKTEREHQPVERRGPIANSVIHESLLRKRATLASSFEMNGQRGRSAPQRGTALPFPPWRLPDGLRAAHGPRAHKLGKAILVSRGRAASTEPKRTLYAQDNG
jgi:hypothetical protein